MIIFIALLIFSLISFIIYCAAACKTKEEQDLSDEEQMDFIRKHNEKKIRKNNLPHFNLYFIRSFIFSLILFTESSFGHITYKG